MIATTFDTLSAARRLRERGVLQEQAEAFADEIRIFSQVDESRLPMKADLRELELRLQTQLKDIEIRIGGMIVALGGILIAIRYFG